MSRWALPTMKQTVWVIPCVGLDTATKNRGDPQFDLSAAYEVRCRFLQDSKRTIVVDGKGCAVSAEISTYESIAKTARIAFTATDATDLNTTHVIGRVVESPDMVPSADPLFKVYTI